MSRGRVYGQARGKGSRDYSGIGWGWSWWSRVGEEVR